MSILTERLWGAAALEYPGVPLSQGAAFMPMHSLDSGEVSTTAAVEIARITKQSAQEIAARLISALSGAIPAQWRNDNGYIVCSGLSAKLLLSEVQESVRTALAALGDTGLESDSSRSSVYCLLPDSTEPVYARLRVLARAMVQVVLAVVYRGRTTASVAPCKTCEVSSIAEVINLFRESVLWILEHESESRLNVSLPQAVDCAAVWTTHHYHDRLDATVRRELAHLRESGTVRLTMPADGWLLSRDRALSEILAPKSLRKVIGAVRGLDGWYQLLWHFASTTPSGDFDPAVALFEESSSPMWNVRALQARFERFKGRLQCPQSVATLTELIRQVERFRPLILSGLFMPVYTARAILHNEVATWCGVFERLSRDGHIFLNAPETRIALEQNEVDATVLEIAAGLSFGLSCIVPLVTEA